MVEDLNAVDLARVQFAFTIAFHIVFPAFTIGLASYLAVLEGLWLATGDDLYLDVFRYWLKIFAVAFAMGVVSGIVMSYEIGTNWSVFADKTGPVLGPLFGYEVLSAFFLEAGFLGVMLFGMTRVGPGLHFAATLMVAAGTLFSAFWILSANSWMQTPAGYTIAANGQFVPEDWWRIVFNPSFPFRFVHMVLAGYLATAFAVGATGAWHLLRDRGNPMARLMFSMAMWMAAVVAPVQIVAGDVHSLNTLQYQPAKIAALEGHFETRRGAPFIVLGLPDMDAAAIRYALQIPKLGSLLLTRDPDGEVRGLDAWPRADWPNVPIVFWCFRIMVGIGIAMAGLGAWSLIARWRGGLYRSPWLWRAALLMGPSGFLAILAGWFVSEVGRQPFTVYGLLRTADSAAPIAAPAVAASLLAFALVYFAVFGAGLFYLLRLMSTPPHAREPGLRRGEPTRAAGLLPGPALKPEMIPGGDGDPT